MRVKTLISMVLLTGLGLALSGCYYAGPAYPSYANDSGYYYGGPGYYYGPSVGFYYGGGGRGWDRDRDHGWRR